jgi:acetyl-CoA synthetase
MPASTARPEVIRKPTGPVPPNLANWEEERRLFTWQSARALLAGLPGGGVNVAHECVWRHADRDGNALRWLGARGERGGLSWNDLARRSRRAASALARVAAPGERVFLLLPRVLDLHVAAMGALAAKLVVCPLFSAFGPEPIRERMALGDARVLVTTASLYTRKVAPIRGELPGLQTVLIVGAGPLPEGTASFETALAAAPEGWRIPPTSPEDPALLHFTSGTTGRPKGALHVHRAVLHHAVSARYALDLRPGDLFWCTADPGWVTGTSYGLVAPLALGVESLAYEGEFDASAWATVLREEGVSVWYTAPTAIRMMMRAGIRPAGATSPQAAAGAGASPTRADPALPRLRFVASVGEPLNAEAVRWGVEALGQPIHDNWWQTETGGILVANYAAMDIRPGSMGRPLPGIEVAILRRGPDGALVRVAAGEEGELAVRRGWPGQFREYLGNPERTAQCFDGDWYLSGDIARADQDGYLWFVGRADDVIKTAGHLVGPFEVERVLCEHPAVVEAAAVGLPDPVAGQFIKAFVVLRPGFAADEPTRLAIFSHARRRLGAALAPKEVAIVATLPRTRSGKILRRLLRARELGLPEGDTSTLEAEAR